MFSNCYQLWLKGWHCHFLSPLSEQCIIVCWSSQELSSKFPLKFVSNRKMLKSYAAICCTKRHGSRVSFHIFPVGKVRQKQWLASLGGGGGEFWSFVGRGSRIVNYGWTERVGCRIFKLAYVPHPPPPPPTHTLLNGTALTHNLYLPFALFVFLMFILRFDLKWCTRSYAENMVNKDTYIRGLHMATPEYRIHLLSLTTDTAESGLGGRHLLLVCVSVKDTRIFLFSLHQ